MQAKLAIAATLAVAAQATTYEFYDNCAIGLFKWRKPSKGCGAGVADEDCYWSFKKGKGPFNRWARCRELPNSYNISDNAQLSFDMTNAGLSKNHSKGLCFRDCEEATADKECRMSYVTGDAGGFNSARAMYRCMDVAVPTYVDVIAGSADACESDTPGCSECVFRTYSNGQEENVCVDTTVFQYRNSCDSSSERYPWLDRTRCASDNDELPFCFMSYPVGDRLKWMSPEAACRTVPEAYKIAPEDTTFAAAAVETQQPDGTLKGLCEEAGC